MEFVKASGSLKEMASILNVSYPTVRNRLDEIIDKLNNEVNAALADAKLKLRLASWAAAWPGARLRITGGALRKKPRNGAR